MSSLWITHQPEPCTKQSGGGVFLSSPDTVTSISNTNFFGNEARIGTDSGDSDGGGGAITVFLGKLLLSGVVFSDNTASMVS